MEEKADCRPYHCAWYLSRPVAMVMGSVNVALSDHSWSFARDGRPAKRSRTEPTMVFCWSERETPAAVSMFLFSILRVESEGGPPVDMLTAEMRGVCLSCERAGLVSVRRVFGSKLRRSGSMKMG